MEFRSVSSRTQDFLLVSSKHLEWVDFRLVYCGHVSANKFTTESVGSQLTFHQPRLCGRVQIDVQKFPHDFLQHQFPWTSAVNVVEIRLQTVMFSELLGGHLLALLRFFAVSHYLRSSFTDTIVRWVRLVFFVPRFDRWHVMRLQRFI